jgi:hypothetical protein
MYQERVKKEKSELDGKIWRLKRFMGMGMYENLSYQERSRLINQLDYMEKYSNTLGERIENFS